MALPHPALAVLRMRRITNRRVARDLGYTEDWIGRVLNGHDRPSAKFRRDLAAYLDLPEVALFRDQPQDGAA
jgi:transcriptional regulator with XRE-family HTH domain